MLDNMFTPIREWFADSTFGRIIKSMLLAILPATWATRLFGEETVDPTEDGTET